jgi:predicted RNA-binding Zn-ribbon protein involved in translation (DUF1610 family)
MCNTEYEVEPGVEAFDCPVCKKRLVARDGKLLFVGDSKLEGPKP